MVKNGRANGVVLTNGDEIYADVVSSSVDPRLTFTKMIEPGHLPDEFMDGVKRYKFRGSSGKVNMALDGLPNFKCMPGVGAHLRGAMSISPSVEYMEKAYDEAKYGHWSSHPYIDMVIPTLTDTSLAPPGKHILSCFVQYAPYKLAPGLDWDTEKEKFGDNVVNTIAEYAPNIKDIILHRQVVTPLDLERTWGLTEGNIFQGELSLEQLFFLRPVAGWAQFRSPIKNLYMCGSATHPGGGIMGAPGRLAALEILKDGSRLMSEQRPMAETRDVIIVGGGHNGLVTAFYLAKAGFKPLVLERRAQVGGAAITEEFHPGFRCSTLAHNSGPLRADIVRDMQLEQHGLKLTTPDVNTVSLLPDGRALVLYSDAKKAAQEIAQWSQKDAASYADFGTALGKIGKVIGEALALTPPNIDSPSSGDLWGMLKTGRSIRNLGKKDLYRVLRWGPMAAADLVAEFFDTEPLRATIAARGIFGTFLGPWSAGSALVLMLRAAADQSSNPAPAGSVQFPTGGIGAITLAMAAAAKQAGAEIRTNAEIAEIRVKDGVATGVVLTSGEEIAARAVVSNADPKRTLMRLVDPTHLTPGLRAENQELPLHGDGRKNQSRAFRTPGIYCS